jgi:cell division protease FtsH
MAHNMVKKWGLSERLGPLQYDDEADEVFLGRSSAGQNKVLSGETTKAIDEEVRSIIDTCYGRAQKILEDNRDKLDAMKDALMEWETIDAGQIDDIMNGKKPRTPEGWHDDDYGSGKAAKVEAEESSDKDNKKESNKPIGGPAGEH